MIWYEEEGQDERVAGCGCGREVECPECDEVAVIDDEGFRRCPSCDPAIGAKRGRR